MAKAAELARQNSPLLSRSVRESGMWLFGALAVIMLLALLSYSPADPGFSNTGTGSGKLDNLIGAAGAWFADFAFYLFRLPAYLFPGMALLLGWHLCINRSTGEPLDRPELTLRSTGFLIALLTSCGLATLHFGHPDLRETAGGALGQLVGYNLESGLGLLGATLLLLSAWLAAISLCTGVSWLSIMDWVGHQVLEVIDQVRVGGPVPRAARCPAQSAPAAGSGARAAEDRAAARAAPQAAYQGGAGSTRAECPGRERTPGADVRARPAGQPAAPVVTG